VDDDGMVVVRGRLDPEVGAVFMRAIEAASDALFKSEEEQEVTPEQRRADAVGLLAERALAAGFAKDDQPMTGSRAERYQVMLHVDADTLDEDAEPGLSELEDGTRLRLRSARRSRGRAHQAPFRGHVDGRSAPRKRPEGSPVTRAS
jgi:hypothetical protein